MSHYAEDGTLKFETPQQEILFLKQQLASSHMIRDEQEKTIEKYREVQGENERLYDENEQLKDEKLELENMLGESYSKHDVSDMEMEIERLQEENIQLKQSIVESMTKFVEETDKLKEEVEGLREKLDKGTEEHMKDTKKLNEFVEKNYVPKKQIEKLKEEIEQLKDQLTKQHEYVDTMEYETKIEQLEGFNGGQEFWNDAEDVLEVLQNDGFDEEEIKHIIEDKCSGYTYDIDKEELVKVE